MSADTQPAAAPGPCARCGHSEREHTWNNAIHGGYNRLIRCGEWHPLPREGDELVVRYKFCECAAYTPQEPPVTQPDQPVTIAARDESAVAYGTEAPPVWGGRGAPASLADEAVPRMGDDRELALWNAGFAEATRQDAEDAAIAAVVRERAKYSAYARVYLKEAAARKVSE